MKTTSKHMVFRKQNSIYDVITHMNKMEIVNETCQKTGAALTDITVVRRTQGSSTGRPNDIQIGSTYYDITNPGIDAHLEQDPQNTFVVQSLWTLTYDIIILEMEIGKGSSGTAYTCTV